MRPRVAVLRLPGVNGEEEAARAVAAVGLEPVLFPWTGSARELSDHEAYLLPGGFSYQDRVRAGAVAARHPWIETVRRRAAEGAPVLGICNGAQILVEAGLVPGDAGLEAALAPNRMPDREGYHARWIWCEVARGRCLFTAAYAPGERVPLPVAHGEGRFVSAAPERWRSWLAAGRLPLRYAPPPAEEAVAGGTPGGEPPFPWNPNGAEHAAAGLTNGAGNVLALMPHPERGDLLLHVPPDLPGAWGDRRRRLAAEGGSPWAAGPGRGFFLSLAAALGVEDALPAATGVGR